MCICVRGSNYGGTVGRSWELCVYVCVCVGRSVTGHLCVCVCVCVREGGRGRIAKGGYKNCLVVTISLFLNISIIL